MSTPHTGSLWRIPALRNLTGIAVLAFTSFFLTLSALPAWAAREGVPASTAGSITTVMLACTIVVQLSVPGLTRRFGITPVIVAGLVALGAPAPLYLVRSDLWWLLVVSAVRGCGFGIVTVLLPLLAARVAPSGRQGEAIGLYGLAIALPNLIAVPGAVALTSAGMFSLAAVLAASPVLAIPLVRALAAAAPAPGPAARPAAGGVGRALLAVAPVVTVLTVVTLAGGGLLTYLPIERPDGSLATIALLIFGGTGALARWRAGLLSDRHGSRILLPVMVVVAAVGMAAAAAGLLAGSTTLILVGSGVLGLGYGAVQGLSLMVAFALAGPGHQTTASATWNAAFDGGTAVGALLIGALAGTGLGTGWSFAISAVLIGALLPAAIGSGRRAERPAG